MKRPVWQWVLGWLGLAALLVMLIFYAASGLLAPAWAVIVLLVVWAALLVVAIRFLRARQPLYVLPVPVRMTAPGRTDRSSSSAEPSAAISSRSIAWTFPCSRRSRVIAPSRSI